VRKAHNLNMGLDTEGHCKNVEDVPFKNTAPMADAPTVLSVTTSKPKGCGI